MPDVQEITQDLVDQLTEYIQDAPSPIDKVLNRLVYMDELYEVCEQYIIDELAAEEEARRDEAKLEEIYNDED